MLTFDLYNNAPRIFTITSETTTKKTLIYLKTISRKFFYIFRTLRSILDKIQLRIICISLVQSIFTYCVKSWGCLPNYTSSDTIYKELNEYCTNMAICNHIANTRFKKNSTYNYAYYLNLYIKSSSSSIQTQLTIESAINFFFASLHCSWTVQTSY
ncbi:Reverse transcriptase domain-containing protein [Aphis craccivora]|uniref:Reverse transcriptase domain-containing protein n=1 Tax=Aphis craccivora TaxID=307492 RepID=A0A6G0YG44_APHCR|nr:Reverse transcriptase domain-containing protein [Aphis craccivora]